VYQQLLVPLDGSELSEAVLPHVEGLALRLAARVHLVRVANLPATVVMGPMDGPVPPGVLEDALQAEIDEARQYLTGVAGRLQGRGLQVTWEVLEGNPAQAIIAAARQHGCDLIAMATHGRSGLPRLVLGSVADRVLREAHLPVLLVRPPAAAS
jgi:nucleotide-binding universal stress UspA family protein